MTFFMAIAALLVAFAADPPADAQRGASQEANQEASSAQRSSRGSGPGGEEREGGSTGGIQSGQANGMAGGRTDEGPEGGTGIRGDGARVHPRARAKADSQARGRNRKGSMERPSHSPPDINRNPTPIGSGAPATAAGQPAEREGRIPAGPQAGAAGGVSSGTEDAPGASAPKGPVGKGAETQPDKKQTGSEPDTPR